MFQATVFVDQKQPIGKDLLLSPGKNLYNGVKEFSREFGEITTLELDLLNVASSIFACDLAFQRKERENISRKIELTVPVVNFDAFTATRDEIQYALYFLSHDAWQISFIPASGVPEENKNWSRNDLDALLLFSGGLDSFSAAIDLGESKNHVELISHVTANPIVKGTQEKLYTYLVEQFPEKFHRVSFYVTGRKSGDFLFPPDGEREESQRTRSFMFLTLAALVARRKGICEIVYIAENGQMAIHLPLTAARISAFSTYTAHPEFLAIMQELLGRLLHFPLAIDNPYLYQTKAEVVRNVVKNHQGMIAETISCWKASRVPGEYNHCGLCVPCLIRRIALEFNGLDLHEYREDLLQEDVATLSADHEGKRNLSELGEFIKIFDITKSQAELEATYPDLVNQYFDTNEAASMYKRFAKEAQSVFGGYPAIRRLME